MQEAAAYYSGYRSDRYLLQRQQYEPFYTRKVHAQVAAWLASPLRSKALLTSLNKCDAHQPFCQILDWGGGSGALLSEIPASSKAVYDLDETEPQPGIRRFSSADQMDAAWDLIICAQVLEHLSDPFEALCSMCLQLRSGGLLYLELPDQQWHDGWQPRCGRLAWLRFLCRHPKLLMIADCIGTACRVKFGWLPAYGFVPMREHINFFTLSSMQALVQRAGLELLLLETNTLGCLTAVARWNATPPSHGHLLRTE